MRILFLSGWFPFPANNGSKLRICNLLRGLAKYHEVSLLSFADQPRIELEHPALRSLCREVRVVPWRPFNPRSARAWRGFVSLTPRSVVDTFSEEMTRRIEEAASSRHYDLVIAFEWGMAAYSRSFQGVAALFENAEVGLLHEQYAGADSTWRRLRYGLTWAKHRAYLARLAHHFRACTVASEQERRLFSRVVPGYQAVEVIPNCLDLAEYETIHGDPQPASLIFTGSFRYSANYDAMSWFLDSVYPRLRSQVPQVRLTITGEHPAAPAIRAENVTLTGFVEDVRPLVASSWISLAPIRAGGGTRLKILEAMALGTPVVATSKGAEGLDVEGGRHLLIADSAEAFAEAIFRVLNDAGLRSRLADQARQLVRDRYNWETVQPRFLDLVERVARA